jgi:hypothetical protein
VNGPDEALRRLVAAEYGLEPEVATFLTGSTLDELDASAAELVTLLGKRREQEQPSAGHGLFADAVAATARRKRELAALFCGRAPQPRDEHGRFARTGGGFDGGARQSAPERRPPDLEHNELLVRMAELSRAFGRRSF